MSRKLVIFISMLLFGVSILAASGEIKEKTDKKKIVFVKDDDGAFFNAVGTLINNLIVAKGWTEDKAEYITLSIQGKESRKAVVVEEIKKINPDVVLINTTLVKDIGMKLKEAKIPVVAGGGLELEDENGNMILVDENGYPTTNLTGTYTMPLTHLKNSFFLLNQIAPLNGKKVVFATYPTAAFTKEKVQKAAIENGIELKDFKEFLYVEDYHEFVEKYNKDPEVGWVLSGEIMGKSRESATYTFEDYFKWERENNNKPNIAFWENSVQNGYLSALAIDSMTTVNQMITMADRILKEEKVENIKPEDPGKVLMILNQKRAQELGIDFSVEMIGSAWKVYIDFEGNFIERE